MRLNRRPHEKSGHTNALVFIIPKDAVSPGAAVTDEDGPSRDRIRRPRTGIRYHRALHPKHLLHPECSTRHWIRMAVGPVMAPRPLLPNQLPPLHDARRQQLARRLLHEDVRSAHALELHVDVMHALVCVPAVGEEPPPAFVVAALLANDPKPATAVGRPPFFRRCLYVGEPLKSENLEKKGVPGPRKAGGRFDVRFNEHEAVVLGGVKWWCDESKSEWLEWLEWSS